MIISLIAAVDEQGGIGIDNRLPWHLSTDLKRFKSLTMGHTVVMGRVTFETIGRSLPGRNMIVLSRQPEYNAENCRVEHSIEAAIQVSLEAGEDEMFIIGGGDVFEQALPMADKIYLTLVHTRSHADVFFPVLDLSRWKVDSSQNHVRDDHDDYASDFFVYVRKN